MATTLTRVHQLRSKIEERSADIDRTRSVPDDVLELLRDAGCFRMAVPTRYGGDDLDIPSILRVVEALALADGSIGWIVGQAAIAQIIFAHFPRPSVDAVYADGPDVLGAGAVAPKGRALRQPGGWRISGRWPFVTGCEHASWIYLQCLVADPSTEPDPEAPPPLRMMLVPATEVTIVDTWQVLGLRGTGSHDVSIRTFCPEERSCPFTAEPPPDTATARLPARDQGGLVVAATACGIAHGALDAIAELAADGKRAAFSRHRLAASAVFQDQLGDAAMTLRAARALLYGEVEAALSTSDPAQPLDRARLRATGPAVVSLAGRAVDTAYALSGGTAVFDRAPVQRRLRDMRTSTQHFSAGRSFYGVLGALLCDEEVPNGLW